MRCQDAAVKRREALWPPKPNELRGDVPAEGCGGTQTGDHNVHVYGSHGAADWTTVNPRASASQQAPDSLPPHHVRSAFPKGTHALLPRDVQPESVIIFQHLKIDVARTRTSHVGELDIDTVLRIVKGTPHSGSLVLNQWRECLGAESWKYFDFSELSVREELDRLSSDIPHPNYVRFSELMLRGGGAGRQAGNRERACGYESDMAHDHLVSLVENIRTFSTPISYSMAATYWKSDGRAQFPLSMYSLPR